MPQQATTISKADLESYRNKWQKEPGATTVGAMRDRISDMCLDLHVATSGLPPALYQLFDRLRNYNLRDAAVVETLLEATEISMEQVEG